MTSIQYRTLRWSDLTGQWEALVRDGFHPAYLGIGEGYAGIEDVDAKLASRSRYGADLWACAAFAADRLVGFVVGPLSETRLVIDDIVVARDVRRQGIGRQLVQRAIHMSGVGVVAAEVNHANIASQALFQGLGFTTVRSSDWVVCRVPSVTQDSSTHAEVSSDEGPVPPSPNR
jgi:ribosomal protein S18 acetylase RimI-like enzyme